MIVAGQTIPEEYNNVVPRDEDTAIRKSDLAAFKKAMKKEWGRRDQERI